MSAARVFPIVDPGAWSDDFERWAGKHCAFRDGCSGGVKCLHNHFSEWCLAESVPCRLEEFKALIRDEGFRLQGELVYGLILIGDYEFFQKQERGAK